MHLYGVPTQPSQGCTTVKHGYYASPASFAERALSSIMKIGRAMIGFIVKFNYFSECYVYLFVIVKNGLYLQECLAAFIWGVKMYRGGEGGSTDFFRLFSCVPDLCILKVE